MARICSGRRSKLAGIRPWEPGSDVGDTVALGLASKAATRMDRSFSDRSFQVVFIPREGLQVGEMWSRVASPEPAIRLFHIQRGVWNSLEVPDRQRRALDSSSL